MELIAPHVIWAATIVFSVLWLTKLANNTKVAEEAQNVSEALKSIQERNDDLERRITAQETKVSALSIKRAFT
jgi:hypothetical protein